MFAMVSTMFPYRLAVLYRLVLILVIGYACTSLLTVNLSIALQYWLQKADAVYLAAIIAILFYLTFFIIGFCIPSLKKLSTYSVVFGLFLFAIYQAIG